MYKSKGNSLVATPIVLVISILFIIFIGIFTINNILPFIWYEKLNNIALKYIFVIEKYGYLTDSEIDSLKSDMQDQGFDISKIIIDVPKEQKNYGELIEFSILYNYNQENLSFNEGKIGIKSKIIPIKIVKNSYCKN